VLQDTDHPEDAPMYEQWHKLQELLSTSGVLDHDEFRHLFEGTLNEWYEAGYADGIETMCGIIARAPLIESGLEI